MESRPLSAQDLPDKKQLMRLFPRMSSAGRGEMLFARRWRGGLFFAACEKSVDLWKAMLLKFHWRRFQMNGLKRRCLPSPHVFRNLVV